MHYHIAANFVSVEDLFLIVLNQRTRTENSHPSLLFAVTCTYCQEMSSRDEEKKRNLFRAAAIGTCLVVIIVGVVVGSILARNEDNKGVHDPSSVEEGKEAPKPTLAPITPTGSPTLKTPTSLRPALLPSIVPSLPMMPTTATTTPTNHPSSPPSSVPSGSSRPTLVPSTVPSLAPSTTPSQLPTSQPSARPSATPLSLAPTKDVSGVLISSLRPVSYNPSAFQDTNSPASLAVQWLAETALKGDVDLLEDEGRLVQRFAVLNTHFSTFGITSLRQPLNLAGLPRIVPHQASTAEEQLDECSWLGVTCNETVVKELAWSGLQWQGTIPRDIALLKNLTKLDLGENNVEGSIPNQLYYMTDLERVYLHQNSLTGPLSREGLSNLSSLVWLLLGENKLTGSIPALDHGNHPLRFFNLYNNKFSGTLPRLDLRQLYLLDFGRNKLTGQIPQSWYNSNNLRYLKHLYLDYNKLTGSLPNLFLRIGTWRTKQIVLNDNRFTGVFPTGFEASSSLEALEIQNNRFTGIGKRICNMSVLINAELSALRTDCKICPCDNSVICKPPSCTAH